MSCHDIGRGMNSVVRVIMGLYDDGQIGIKPTKQIIAQCARGVYWCDGNVSEATDYIRRCCCGKCLKLVPKGEKLYSVWDVSSNVPNAYRLISDYNMSSDGLCEACFDTVINSCCGDPNAGMKERAYIEAHEKNDRYESEGAYRPSNNGVPWPRD